MEPPGFGVRPRVDLAADLASVVRRGAGGLDRAAVAHRRQCAISHDPVLWIKRRRPQPLVLRADPGVVVGVVGETSLCATGRRATTTGAPSGRNPTRSRASSQRVDRDEPYRRGHFSAGACIRRRSRCTAGVRAALVRSVPERKFRNACHAIQTNGRTPPTMRMTSPGNRSHSSSALPGLGDVAQRPRLEVAVVDRVVQLQHAQRQQGREDHPRQADVHRTRTTAWPSFRATCRPESRSGTRTSPMPTASMPYTPIIAAWPWLAVSAVPIW